MHSVSFKYSPGPTNVVPNVHTLSIELKGFSHAVSHLLTYTLDAWHLKPQCSGNHH